MKKLFVDLEETIIDDIDSCNPLWDNIRKVQHFIRNEAPEAIETFSFALWGAQERSNWRAIQTEMFPEINTQSFDIDTLKFDFLKSLIGRVEKHEMFDFLKLITKDRVFEWMIQKDFAEGEFILIDDTVQTHTLITKQNKMTIRVINVGEL